MCILSFPVDTLRKTTYVPIIIQVKSTLPTTSFPLYSGSVYVILTICHSESKLLHHGLPALSIYTCLAFQVLIPYSRQDVSLTPIKIWYNVYSNSSYSRGV
uniref:Uncharacterized protein n=1 Tax=Cacopsylla melanoneura TaxID=428564 RepID=A0A8D9ANE8_9HEMI